MGEVVATVTGLPIALVFSREPLRLKGGFRNRDSFDIVVPMDVLHHPAPSILTERSHLMLERVLKIQLFTFVGLLVLYQQIMYKIL